MLVAGILIIVAAALAALKASAEVIAGFNVDGLAMMAIAVGGLLILRGLLGSGTEVQRTSAQAPPLEVRLR
jgi:hypothetical protein